MEVWVERMIEKPFQPLATTLAGGPDAWLPGEGGGDPATAELDVHLGMSTLSRRIVVRTGVLTNREGHGRCSLPIAWEAAEHPGHHPRLAGTLELVSVAARRTRLTLTATYEPPADLVGEAADRAVLDAAAEDSPGAFLARIAAALERAATSQEGEGRS